MKSDTRVFSFLILPAAAILLAACGEKVVVQPTAPAPSAMLATPAPQSPGVVVTIPAMPAPPEDTAQGTSPGATYTWVAGYYNWQGDHYQWVPGAWVSTPATSSVWVPGRWQPSAGGYIWVGGHWQ
jgi:hypothetical protein